MTAWLASSWRDALNNTVFRCHCVVDNRTSYSHSNEIIKSVACVWSSLCIFIKPRVETRLVGNIICCINIDLGSVSHYGAQGRVRGRPLFGGWSTSGFNNLVCLWSFCLCFRSVIVCQKIKVWRKYRRKSRNDFYKNVIRKYCNSITSNKLKLGLLQRIKFELLNSVNISNTSLGL